MKRLLLALAFVLFWCQPAAAVPAATGQQCNARTTGSQASVSCTVSVTAGNSVVMFGLDDASVRTGAYSSAGCSDDQGNTYKIVNKQDVQGVSGYPGIKLCFAYVGTTASTVFTWTPQGGNDLAGIVVFEISGLVTPSALDQTRTNVTNSGNHSTLTTNATTTNDQIIIAGIEVTASGTFTCDSGYTQIAEDETYTSVAYSTCYKVVSSTGTQTHTWTNPSSHASSIIATFASATPGLTGSGIYWTGHQCRTDVPIGNRVHTEGCGMGTVANSLIVLIGHSQESRAGTTNANGCADSIGNTYTFVAISNTAPGVKQCYTTMSAADTGMFTWTAQTSDTWISIDVVEFAGTLTASAVDVTASAGTGASPSANAASGTTGTTSQADEVVIASASVNATGTLTCGAGYTQIDEFETNTAVAFSDCYKIVSATGTQQMTWTSPSAVYDTVIATFKSSASGTTPTFSPLDLLLARRD